LTVGTPPSGRAPMGAEAANSPNPPAFGGDEVPLVRGIG